MTMETPPLRDGPQKGRRWSLRVLPLSLSAWAGFYLFLTFVLFIGVNWLTLLELDKTDRRLTGLQQQTAADNLRGALTRTREKAVTEARALGQWDETHQQLDNPTYYSYWHGYRLLRSEHLGTGVLQAHIHDANGHVLARLDAIPVPASIEHTGQWITLQHGKPILLTWEPIFGRDDPVAIRGHVGLTHDFKNKLLGHGHFSLVDSATLQFDLEEDHWIEASELESHLRYELHASPQADAFREVLDNVALRTAITVAILALLFYFLQTAFVAVPLRRLSRAIEHMRSSGSHVLEIPTLPIRELDNIRASLLEHQDQLHHARGALDRQNQGLWDLAHRDALTGVYNRRAFDSDLAHQAGVLGGHRIDVAFVLFDCDHFKTINDTYGHALGDKVIQIQANCLTTGLRDGDRLYRIGGDEFATVLLSCTETEARTVAERCLHRLHQFDFGQLGILEPVRMSAGIAHTVSGDLTGLPRQADIAMYLAKRPQSPPVQVYDVSMGETGDALVSSAVANSIKQVLQSADGLEMHYQPVIDAKTGTIAYFESLARIRTPTGLLMPHQFLPFVEAHRLECEFDLAVLNAVQADLESGRIAAGSGVAINLSGHSVVEPEFFQRLSALQPYRKRYRLVLEVTETALIRHFDLASRNLNQARSTGFEVALDDFGSGYSSLRYLSDMPVDVIKFDRSMILQMMQEGRSRRLIESIVTLIRENGYRMVAEGLETEDILERARALGFDYLQGYFLGRPARSTLDRPR